MADDIRMRRLHTEKENIKKIDPSKIQIEEQSGYLNRRIAGPSGSREDESTSNNIDAIVFKISFNLKDHPFNLDLLKEKSEYSSSVADDSIDNEIHNTSGFDEETFENNEPIDEMEDREYEFDLIVPK